MALSCLATLLLLLLLLRPEGAQGAELQVSGAFRSQGGRLVLQLWPAQQVRGEALQQQVGWGVRGQGAPGTPWAYAPGPPRCVFSSSKKPKSPKKPAIATSPPPRKALELRPLHPLRGPG
ncbi:hypothetical protein GW7_07834 [Heterocephalus glaber]|uniref:Uncharacterized protein n=1 Tax=Heterocephalus glaber TaxID=10181 RepID=G5BN80_HETGA|nr:hypothetical protein GW7_07834 [Heterocephalus glaber]